MNHIWKDEKVKICQINSTIDQINSRYKNIINNTKKCCEIVIVYFATLFTYNLNSLTSSLSS